MSLLLLVVAVMAASVVVVGVGDRLSLPWPALMVVLGAGVAFIPGVDALSVDPELILPLFLPPLLYATARRTSWAMFRSRWRSVVGLALALTAVTIALAAGTAWALVPGITLTAAVAVGAAVAPPDPVAVEAVAGPLNVPRRLLAVLRSEGLFNDAVALVVFQAATAALVRGDELDVSVLGRFVYGLVVAVAVGLAVAWLAGRLRDRLTDVTGRNALSLVLPFAVYLAADELGASGVIAVVVAALQVRSHQSADQGEDRLSGGALWDVVEMLVTGVAFALVGAELRSVVTDAGDQLPRMLLHAAVVVAVVLAVRALWLFGALPVVARSDDPTAAPRSWREALVLTWCGMRGLATIALALALPQTVAGGRPFPGRTEAIVIACSVLVVTLLGQAFTLPVLLRRLGVSEDTEAAQAAETAISQRARRAARDVLLDPSVLADADPEVTEEIKARLDRLNAMLTDEAPDPDYRGRLEQAQRRREQMSRLETRALDAARAEVLDARSRPGTDPDAADRVLRRLDLRDAPLP